MGFRLTWIVLGLGYVWALITALRIERWCLSIGAVCIILGCLLMALQVLIVFGGVALVAGSILNIIAIRKEETT